MRKRLIALFLVLIIGLPIYAGAEVAAPDEGQAQWTVLMYLCGTDLESEYSCASGNLSEIMQTVPNDEVQLVIQTGGTRAWHSDEQMQGLALAQDKLQRYHYDMDGFHLDMELPLQNMASAQTLTDFVRWGAERYPAEKTMLVLWGHGGGSASGVISDELFNDATMSLDQLEHALSQAGVPLEAILMDSCLMASLETAQAVQHSARYLIASEEIVPGSGVDYSAWLQYLYDSPHCDGARLGKKICDSVQRKYADLGGEATSKNLTFSVIDLSKIDALVAAFEDMIGEMGALLLDPEAFCSFAYYTNKVQRFETPSMVDLADLAERARNRAVSNRAAGAVLDAVDDAVIYSVKGSMRSYANGLSFLYDLDASDLELNSYTRNCKSAKYLAFLDAVSMNWAAPNWVYEQTERLDEVSYYDYVPDFDLSLTETGQPMLEVTNAPAAVMSVTATIYQYDELSQLWLRLGEDPNVAVDIDSNRFYASFPARWLAIDGKLCEMTLVEEANRYNLFSIPFQIASEGEDAFEFEFRAGYEFDTGEAVQLDEQTGLYKLSDGHYQVYGVWDMENANSLALATRNVWDVSEFLGEEIQLSRRLYRLGSDKDQGQQLSESFVVSKDIELQDCALPEGLYFICYNLKDVFGRLTQSDILYVKWDGEKASYSLTGAFDEGEATMGADAPACDTEATLENQNEGEAA